MSIAGRESTLMRVIDAPREKLDRETHEKMGFQEGWGKATDQLAVYMTAG
jgi:uncharacterized protein YndB with AHSA1/START domain